MFGSLDSRRASIFRLRLTITEITATGAFNFDPRPGTIFMTAKWCGGGAGGSGSGAGATSGVVGNDTTVEGVVAKGGGAPTFQQQGMGGGKAAPGSGVADLRTSGSDGGGANTILGGKGGDSAMGFGSTWGNSPATGSGGGGGGADGNGGGGGGAETCEKVYLVPRRRLTGTIATGGTGGAGAFPGKDGASGRVIFREWGW